MALCGCWVVELVRRRGTSNATTLPSSRIATRSISWFPFRVRRWPTLASAAWAGTRMHKVAKDSKRWPSKVPSCGPMVEPFEE